jgi:chorismate dehydratase
LPVASGNSWQLATGNWQLNSEALLLIGDKVVCEEPAGFEHQLDLGQAWKELTGLPFVFAVWMARDGVELGELPVRLEEARREGLRHVEEIIAEHAIPRGWPAEVARRYLTSYLKYDVGPRQLHAIREFHRLAAKHGAIEGELAELRLYSGRHGTGK